MDNLIENYLEKKYGDVPESFSGKQDLKNILELEIKLGVFLPNDYIYFLKNYGSGNICDTEIYGLGSSEFFGELCLFDKIL